MFVYQNRLLIKLKPVFRIRNTQFQLTRLTHIENNEFLSIISYKNQLPVTFGRDLESKKI